MLPVEIKEVEIGDMVSTHDEEIPLFEVCLGILHAPCSPELDLFVHVGDIGPKERPVAQRILDCIPHVPEGDHDLAEPEVGEVGDKVLYRGAVHDGNTGLWALEREGAEACPLSPTHDAHLHTHWFHLHTLKPSGRMAFSGPPGRMSRPLGAY